MTLLEMGEFSLSDDGHNVHAYAVKGTERVIALVAQSKANPDDAMIGVNHQDRGSGLLVEVRDGTRTILWVYGPERRLRMAVTFDEDGEPDVSLVGPDRKEFIQVGWDDGLVVMGQIAEPHVFRTTPR